MDRPMLARLADASFLKEKGYIFEPKIDGIRAVCHIEGNKLKLINRKGTDITKKYPDLLEIRKNVKASECILDGEIAVYNDGLPDFHLVLRRDQSTNSDIISSLSEEYPAIYIVFDIMMKDGKNLESLPLVDRKKILDKTVVNGSRMEKIFYTEKGQSLWNQMQKMDMEGVIAKIKKSKYDWNSRTQSWLKIKILKTVDCIILGYTTKKRKIASLALGLYRNDELAYIGNVGTGFTQSLLTDLEEKLGKIEISKPASTVFFPAIKNIQAVKPKYICEVRFQQVTRDKMLRAPAFIALRNDKKPIECTWEDQIKQTVS